MSFRDAVEALSEQNNDVSCGSKGGTWVQITRETRHCILTVMIHSCHRGVPQSAYTNTWVAHACAAWRGEEGGGIHLISLGRCEIRLRFVQAVSFTPSIPNCGIQGRKQSEERRNGGARNSDTHHTGVGCAFTSHYSQRVKSPRGKDDARRSRLKGTTFDDRGHMPRHMSRTTCTISPGVNRTPSEPSKPDDPPHPMIHIHADAYTRDQRIGA